MRRNPHPKGKECSDCGTRALVLALGLDYQETWEEITRLLNRHRVRWGRSGGRRLTANGGVTHGAMAGFLRPRGWHYVKAPTGTKFHARNLPAFCIAQQAGHLVLVRDGAIWDSWDSRGKRAKRLNGWWEPKGSARPLPGPSPSCYI